MYQLISEYSILFYLYFVLITLQCKLLSLASLSESHYIQLYAEPSVIYYIRNNFDISECIIVSPDAGGAKRCVL